MGQFIDLTSADGFNFPAYVAQPAGQARGGVVVLQEIFGVNSHIRSVADRYAAEGYLAVAPSTFHRVKAGVELGYQPEDMKAGMGLKAAVENLGLNPQSGSVMADVQAAISYASRAGKVGVVGYCWGGLLTWRAACLLSGVNAVVPYYGGGITTDTEVARQPHCPVLAHFGEQDQWIPLDGVERLQRAHPSMQAFIYPAHHGFNCDQRGAWNAEAAQLARERTYEFFARQLG